MKVRRAMYIYRCKQCGKTVAVEDALHENQYQVLPPYDRLSSGGGFSAGALMTRTHNCLGQAYGIAELIGLRVIYAGADT